MEEYNGFKIGDRVRHTMVDPPVQIDADYTWVIDKIYEEDGYIIIRDKDFKDLVSVNKDYENIGLCIEKV